MFAPARRAIARALFREAEELALAVMRANPSALPELKEKAHAALTALGPDVPANLRRALARAIFPEGEELVLAVKNANADAPGVEDTLRDFARAVLGGKP